MGQDRLTAVANQLQSEAPTLTRDDAMSLAAAILGESVDGGAPHASEENHHHPVDAALKVRALALAVDVGVVGLIWLVVVGLLMIAVQENPRVPYPLVGPCLAGCYFVVSWWRFGCTPGMYAVDVRVVVARTGKRPGLLCALLRLCMLGVTCLPLGVGLLSSAFSSDNRSWYDQLAGTRLVTVSGSDG